MAKATAPLMSVSASGKIKHRLTFSNKKVGNIVRLQRKNRDAQSADQLTQRSAFSEAVGAWNALTNEQKQVWRDLAETQPVTGFNLFLKDYLTGEPEPILITEIRFYSPSNAYVTFSAPVTTDGTPDAVFQVQDNDSNWRSASAVSQTAANRLSMTFGPYDFDVGNAWRLTGVPSHIAEAALITVPQNGTITF